MAGFQQTIIIGNVGRDPEMRYTQSGIAVCGFSVAVTEKWNQTNADGSKEKREKTTWYRVSAWRALAEVCQQYVHKGMPIMVAGTVEARGYLNNAGEVASSLELTARDIQFLGSRGDGGGNSPAPSDEFAPPPRDVNDIPF